MSNAGPASLTVDERDYYERQIFDLRQLLEVSKILNSTLNYATLIDSILYSIMGQFKVLRAGLFAKKGIDSDWLSFHRNYKGFDVAKGIDYSISEGHPAIRLFQRQYGCYTLDDIQGRFGSLKGLEALTALKPDLVVPLKVKGVINGIIVIGERIEGEADFTPLEREYLVNVAVMAAIAINNAFLFEMTTTDMMTRLKMKHYFYTVLLERMEKCGISGKPLSVMMIDIDHFKHFNDEHGHQCGDVVLKNVAHVLQKLVRGEDIAARYGGEEFCILLPDTDGPAAGHVAERIRSAVARSVVEYEGKRLSVTVSIGVAQFRVKTDYTAKVIIERADRALYSSKADGRNRTTIAES